MGRTDQAETAPSRFEQRARSRHRRCNYGAPRNSRRHFSQQNATSLSVLHQRGCDLARRHLDAADGIASPFIALGGIRTDLEELEFFSEPFPLAFAERHECNPVKYTDFVPGRGGDNDLVRRGLAPPLETRRSGFPRRSRPHGRPRLPSAPRPRRAGDWSSAAVRLSIFKAPMTAARRSGMNSRKASPTRSTIRPSYRMEVVSDYEPQGYVLLVPMSTI